MAQARPSLAPGTVEPEHLAALARNPRFPLPRTATLRQDLAQPGTTSPRGADRAAPLLSPGTFPQWETRGALWPLGHRQTHAPGKTSSGRSSHHWNHRPDSPSPRRRATSKGLVRTGAALPFHARGDLTHRVLTAAVVPPTGNPPQKAWLLRRRPPWSESSSPLGAFQSRSMARRFPAVQEEILGSSCQLSVPASLRYGLGIAAVSSG